MKRKLSVFVLCLICLSLFLAACGKGKEEVRLEALEKNEALIAGADPCCTLEEAQKAGLSFGEEPFDTQENDEKGLESVTYLLQLEDHPLEIAGCQPKSCFFQFINGKLSNITVELTDADSCEAVKAELTRLYGEPEVEHPNANYETNTWNFPADYPVRAALLGRVADGQVCSGSFQVGYFWDELQDAFRAVS